jgi:hypothetical protein
VSVKVIVRDMSYCSDTLTGTQVHEYTLQENRPDTLLNRCTGYKVRSQIDGGEERIRTLGTVSLAASDHLPLVAEFELAYSD